MAQLSNLAIGPINQIIFTSPCRGRERGQRRESAKVKVVREEDISLGGFKVFNLPREKPSRLLSALFKTPGDSTLQ